MVAASSINTSPTVTIRNDTDTATMYTGTATTNTNGDWTVTTSGNSGEWLHPAT